MQKFYAQSGSRSIVISAENAFDAATQLVDHVMGDHIWIYADETLAQNDRLSFLATEALLSLDSEITVSLRGAGRSDQGRFDVAAMVVDWHRLMTGISRMFGQPV